MIYKNITIEQISEILSQYYYVVYDNNNEEEPFLRIYFTNDKIKTNSIEALSTIIKSILVFGVTGIAKIVKAVVKKIEKTFKQKDGAYKRETQFFIQTRGINLEEIFKLQKEFPEIEYEKIHCDNIREVYKMFGLIPARLKFVDEINSALELNIKHYSLIADEMTNLGYFFKLDRNSVRKKNMRNLPLQICNSAPTQILADSALKQKRARITGISGRLLVGDTPRVGTMYNSCMVNETFFKDLITKHSAK